MEYFTLQVTNGKILSSFLSMVCLITIISLMVACGESEEVKEIKRVEEKIAALEKQRDIDLPHMYETNSPKYHKMESDYAHEIAYLKIRRKAFQALRGDVNAYPIAKEYFENYTTLFDEWAINAENDGDEYFLKSAKKSKREYEGYLAKLEKIHNRK